MMPGSQAEPLSLSDVHAGRSARVLGLRGGRSVSDRLASLGLVPGAHVHVLQNPTQGPLLVGVQGTRLALGRGEAAKVSVVLEGEPARDVDA